MSQLQAGTVFNQVFGIYKTQFRVLFGVALIINLVVALLALAGTSGEVLSRLLSFVLSTLFTGMVVRLVQDVQDGRRDWSVGKLLSSVGPVLVPLIVVSILFVIGVVIGFILLIVPGLILITIWAVVAPVVVVEETGAIDAFGRSRALVKGNGWTVFFVLIAVIALSIVVSVIAAVIAGLIGGDVPIFLFTWLLPALVSPLSALVAAVLYFELAHGTPAAPTVPDSEWPETYAPPSAGA